MVRKEGWRDRREVAAPKLSSELARATPEGRTHLVREEEKGVGVGSEDT